MAEFDLISPLIGGVLIGLASIALMAFNGRIAGVSGIFRGLLTPGPDIGWRLLFVLGLVLGGVGVLAVTPEAFTSTIERPSWAIAAAGLLVGFGTSLGSGCTSGHGICGISRFSARSIIATIAFIAAGAITVALVRMGGLFS